MKKAKLLTLSVLSLFTLTLASCGEENAPTKEELVLNAYNNVLATCKTVEQTITISHEGLVYATEEITINTRNGSKTTVTKVANSLDSDTPWTETSEYEVVDLSKANQKLEVSMFTSLTANESLHVVGKISNESVYNIFGLDSNDISGFVYVDIRVSSYTNIVVQEVVVEYESVTGNDVEVVTTYLY
ncbi:MAG: hypothetical protein E7180_01835 [Erysipelotrichaceae bacterium]|nr:hypothetical protein [Erysipelotrichaceae bacterium]